MRAQFSRNACTTTCGQHALSRRRTHVSNVGVAAHICAAAPGGKRYDANMTPEERMDIDNCLWLCQTDAHLIDTDDVTYSVELLRKWKKDAEEYAASALADGNFLRNYHAGNGEKLTQLEELFKSMVARFKYCCVNYEWLDAYPVQEGQVQLNGIL